MCSCNIDHVKLRVRLTLILWIKIPRSWAKIQSEYKDFCFHLNRSINKAKMNKKMFSTSILKYSLIIMMITQTQPILVSSYTLETSPISDQLKTICSFSLIIMIWWWIGRTHCCWSLLWVIFRLKFCCEWIMSSHMQLRTCYQRTPTLHPSYMKVESVPTVCFSYFISKQLCPSFIVSLWQRCSRKIAM